MILDRLAELRGRLSDDDVPAEGYKDQPVRWVLDLAPDGRITGLSPTEGTSKKGKAMSTPYARRTSGISAFLLVDKPAYVLGLDDDGAPSEKAGARHDAYLALLDEAARETGDDRLARLAGALRDDAQLAFARDRLTEHKWATGDLIAPRLDGVFLHRAPSARRFWSARQSETDDGGGLVSECLVCGKEKPIATKHPIEIRVGPNPAPLISMNKPAFRSHGLGQSENAPMCYDCARTYGEALRFLLGSDAHHLYVSGAEWLFWTREPAPAFDPVTLFKEPTPDAVALLRAPFHGHEPSGDADNRFYALVVTGAWKRLVVRSWLDRPLAEVRAALAGYFQRQAVADRDGTVRPQKLLALAGATVRELGDLPPQTVPALLEHALTGRRLPSALLLQALRRAPADRDPSGNATPVTRARAALIRLVLSSTHPDLMTDSVLTPDHPDPAYHCGRLLAVLDGIQSADVNASLVDRFYGSASTTPAAVFGTLVKKAQPHLAKLRKTRRGLYHYFEQQISEITMRIPGFPTTLTPEQQGLFALGYYQQKNRPTTSDAGPADAEPAPTDA